MKYNKKKQPFTIQGRFWVLEEKGEVEYCRILFHNTGHVANIPAGLVKSNDFEDESIISMPKEEWKISESGAINLNNSDIIHMTPVHFDNVDGEGLLFPKLSFPIEDVIEITPVDKPSMVQFIAINPEGDSTDVCVSIEDFCELNNLEVEAVQSCLDGKQKTHKKWRFTTV